MSDHKCVEWSNRNNGCVVCDKHYTNYVEELQATITEQQSHINDLTNEKLTLQYKVGGWKESYENYLDDHDSRFIPPEKNDE